MELCYVSIQIFSLLKSGRGCSLSMKGATKGKKCKNQKIVNASSSTSIELVGAFIKDKYNLIKRILNFFHKGAFNNHVDTKWWVGGKVAIFVHVCCIKNVHGGK